MYTLQIQHPITDFEAWSGAFQRFDEPRRQAGVRSHQVFRPVDDPKFVVVHLEFDTSEAAGAFLGFLESTVWATKENSPGLDGEPQAKILTLAASA